MGCGVAQNGHGGPLVAGAASTQGAPDLVLVASLRLKEDESQSDGGDLYIVLDTRQDARCC